jgi:hypothetical protein
VSGYWPGPWSAEDGGSQRLQASDGWGGLRLQAGETLGATTRRTLMSTMTVLGDPGEVFLLTHSVLRARLGLPTSSRVERIDPVTLATIHASPRLPGGPMWPGGMAIHANGDLYVVYGRYAHRLDRRCRLKASLRLPVDEAYNSFVVLDTGLIVAKNLSRTTPARLSVIDPETMQPACPDILCSEPSIARLSATGDTVYVVGVRSIMRFHWTGETLVEDPDWRFDYVAGTRQTHGWDVVLADGNAWFMDNGEHRYQTSMIRRGVAPSANRLIRVALDDAGDHDAVEISGLPGGSITNPPLYDRTRQIVIGFDSANRHLRAWRFDRATRALDPLWHLSGIGCASHMILDAASGDLITNDYRHGGEEVVVLDIETGAERGRARIGGITQGVVFPSVGWGRDLYWCSMRRVARVFITAA